MTRPFWVAQPDSLHPAVIHVNATPVGGGVAEILQSLVPGQRDEGTNAGWAVVAGDPTFYDVTKYLHHLLHDRAPAERIATPGALDAYRRTLAPQAPWFTAQVAAGDVVVLHDPQVLGLAAAFKASGATVVWHCHIGTDTVGAPGPAAFWHAFARELAVLDAIITTMPQFVPADATGARRFVVPPAIDPGSPKNRDLTTGQVRDLLDGAGLGDSAEVSDGAERREPVSEPGVARVTQQVPLPRHEPVVVQVSRWDPLKDMPGLLRCVPLLRPDAHLVLVGPEPTEIPDDPEGLAVFGDVRHTLSSLEPADARRVHLVNVSPRSPDDGALLVNAVQRRADVVVQKSLQEGFGLTVTEAMLKGKPLVATRVGGLRHQIADGVNGLLVDPADPPAAMDAVNRLLDSPELARTLGARARASAEGRFTMPRLIDGYRAIVDAVGDGTRTVGISSRVPQEVAR